MDRNHNNDIYDDDFLIDLHNDEAIVQMVDANENDGPLQCLRPTTINTLATMLNPTKIIPTESGLARDWRGLAELIGLTSESITYLQSRPDPTNELLKMWSSSSTSSSSTIIQSKNASDLKTFLSVIDRFDVVSDTEPLIDNDITFYKSRLLHHSISSHDGRIVPELDSITENELLTYDDQLLGNGKTTRYDAFLLYSDDDASFAMEIVEKMEKNYHLKMCFKERDLIPGVMFENEVIGRLIEERCNRLLVIFSPSFLQSPANQFLVSYTQALALELRQRKIIPCIYKQCTLPPSVRYSFCLDFNRSSKLWNFWEKLRQSLTTAPPNSSPSRSINSNASFASRSFETSPSTPTSTKYGASLPDDISWWEPNKTPERSKLSTSNPHSSDSGYSKNVDDNFSIKSGEPLLRLSELNLTPPIANDKLKSRKWIRKIMHPMKKKHKDKSVAGAQQVEALEN